MFCGNSHSFPAFMCLSRITLEFYLFMYVYTCGISYCRDVLLPYFNEIYLMPEHPSLDNVNKALLASKTGDNRYIYIFVADT